MYLLCNVSEVISACSAARSLSWSSSASLLARSAASLAAASAAASAATSLFCRDAISRPRNDANFSADLNKQYLYVQLTPHPRDKAYLLVLF